MKSNDREQLVGALSIKDIATDGTHMIVALVGAVFELQLYLKRHECSL